jgi:hypothetical protein
MREATFSAVEYSIALEWWMGDSRSLMFPGSPSRTGLLCFVCRGAIVDGVSIAENSVCPREEGLRVGGQAPVGSRRQAARQQLRVAAVPFPSPAVCWHASTCNPPLTAAVRECSRPGVLALQPPQPLIFGQRQACHSASQQEHPP